MRLQLVIFAIFSESRNNLLRFPLYWHTASTKQIQGINKKKKHSRDGMDGR